MKKLHLLCNAHIDPVWLWQKNEGIAETLSTFRVAADFCEEYDGFIFNHNEALLYEWVETYDPALFRRIQRLVQEGKWVIMGGWYLQPDCVLISGESLLSQIRLGRDYFREKFGVEPKTAVNVDPFGHSRGLVQLLKLNGFEHYLFMRPEGLPRNFIWRGPDGSEIHAHTIFPGYNSLKGQVGQKIRSCISKEPDEIGLCLWGVGNHGGGPSRVDLEQIAALQRESDTEIVHSTADAYFAELDMKDLPVIETSLGPTLAGCYTSMVRIKQANRRLENKLAVTQKILAHAERTTDYRPDRAQLLEARKSLAFCQFHDIMPGTVIKPAEEDSLRTLAHGEELADQLFARAFFKLCEGQETVTPGEIPILAYNPHPYAITQDFEIGFMLENQNWNDNEATAAQVYDTDGNPLPTQNIKPDCTFHLDWIQKIRFRATLAPCAITRFNCRLTVENAPVFPSFGQPEEEILVENDRMRVRISKKTGLIAEYTVDGKTLLENTGAIEVYDDSECPWVLKELTLGQPEGTFRLMSDEESNRFVGYPEETLPSVRIVEDGPVCTRVQAFFAYARSTAVVEYTLPKLDSAIDVKVSMNTNTPGKLFKYALDTGLCGTPWGETAFSWEALGADRQEFPFHKWCGIRAQDAALYVVNNGISGGSFTERSIRLSLLRTPVYAALPIRKRPLTPHNRQLEHIDMGLREFTFRITAEEQVQRQAQTFNEAPYLLSFFPSGAGRKPEGFLELDNPDVILSSVRKTENGHELLLCNYADHPSEATLRVPADGAEYRLQLKPFELKTVTI